MAGARRNVSSHPAASPGCRQCARRIAGDAASDTTMPSATWIRQYAAMPMHSSLGRYPRIMISPAAPIPCAYRESSSPIHPAAPNRIGPPHPPTTTPCRAGGLRRSQETSHEIARAFLLPFLTRPARRIQKRPVRLCAASSRCFLKSRSSVVITVVYASGRPAAPRHRARCFRRAPRAPPCTLVSR